MPSSLPAAVPRVLLVKTSSLGDVIHNLPVASDLAARFPGIELDWLVEEPFAEIPALHPAVRRVIPVALRRWRKALFSRQTWREVSAFRQQLAAERYLAVLDTQGLLKSALLACRACGRHLGYDAASAREPLAARFYETRFAVPKGQHAVVRNRMLAAAAFDYELPKTLDYGLAQSRENTMPQGSSAVLLTAASREDKLWPDAHWVVLGRALAERGLTPLLPGGSILERRRARDLAAQIPGAQAIPPMSLTALADLLRHARLAVGVDTGLSHLAAAVETPVLALYTATEPGLTGVYGVGWHRNLGGKGKTPAVAEVLAALQPVLKGQA
ncbi:MAG: lipopolysaccharide heptosyltransferase I [Zoogloeaceae bacterium]|jgi:heptosyltransferase-1|nr:lipopolysaccharide heptosyltransferase I [Zoogloeaceae bacterium]